MYTPAPRSLWLVPGRAPLTRGECGEDGEDSPGGRGGPARANPGRRVPGARGGWRGRRPLLAGRKLAPRQMATVSTRLGGRGGGAADDGGDPAIARWRGLGSERASEPECELLRAIGEADRHVGWAARGQASPLGVPLLGLRASSPPPAALSPPRPAPGPYSAAPRPPVLRRPLPLPSQPAARDLPPQPPPAPTLPPHPAARSNYHGERRGQPFGEPRNPRSPPRRRPGAGGVRAPLSSQPPGSRCSPRLDSQTLVHTPKRFLDLFFVCLFCKGGYDEWALEM